MSTRVLLTCAAIAVVTGIISAIAGAVSAPVIAVAPVLYGLVLAAHLLPGIVAQALLQQKWVALLTHVLAALVAAAAQPVFIGAYALAIVLFGGVQEGWAAIGKYRRWSLTWFLIGGAISGVLIGGTAGVAIGLKHFDLPGQIATVAIMIAGAIAWTAIGVGIGTALRRAGVARTQR